MLAQEVKKTKFLIKITFDSIHIQFAAIFATIILNFRFKTFLHGTLLLKNI